jgi:hypothetical protein
MIASYMYGCFKNLNTVNTCYNGPGFNGQNLAVYNSEFLEMLRH